MGHIEIIDEKHAASEPSWSCGLSGAYLGALGFRDSSLLVHGSSGCGFAMRYGLSPHWKSFIPCPVTSFGEDDVIFGGKNLLERGIKQIEQSNPSSALFVLTACSTEIIGEDVQGAAAEASRRFGKPVIGVDSGGATGNTIDGYNNFLLRTVETLYPPPMASGQFISEGPPRIDVMGILPYYDMFWRGDIREIRRLLQQVGIELNGVLSGDCSLDTIGRANETSLTATLCKHIGQRALLRIKNRRKGRVHFAQVAPIGIEFTRKWIEEIVDCVGLLDKAHVAILDAEEEKAREIMLRGFDFSKVMFTSGRAAVIGKSSLAIGLVNFLTNELGMRVVMVAFTNRPDQAEMAILEEILRRRGNSTRVLIDQDGETVRRQLVEIRPNIVFGRSTDRVAELSATTAFVTWQFPSTDRLVVYDRPFMGFKGVTSIVDDVINALSRIWY